MALVPKQYQYLLALWQTDTDLQYDMKYNIWHKIQTQLLKTVLYCIVFFLSDIICTGHTRHNLYTYACSYESPYQSLTYCVTRTQYIKNSAIYKVTNFITSTTLFTSFTSDMKKDNLVIQKSIAPSNFISLTEALISYTIIYFKLKFHQKDSPLVRRKSVAIKLFQFLQNAVYSLNSLNYLVIHYIILSLCYLHFF